MVGDLDKSSFSKLNSSLGVCEVYTGSLGEPVGTGNGQGSAVCGGKEEVFLKFNVDGLLRGDYQSRMTGYATARQNGWMSANDIRELENMDRIPEELGGDLYLINGNMTKLQDAGIFAGSGKGKDTGEEVLELEKESDKSGKRTGS